MRWKWVKKRTRGRARCEPLETRRLLSRFAVIGDYSSDTQTAPTRDVSNLVKGWNPDFIATVGDNNYPDGGADTIDANVGQWYHDYISPYTGSFGAGSASGNRFWPTIGNHDWNSAGAGYQPYINYFTLPGNERYYTQTLGNVELFVVNSDTHEPDGTSSTSTQGQWLQQQLAASTATWKLVLFHHPAYSSGATGSNTYMQWPFQQWGASAVISGHDHDYERVIKNNFPYFVDGLGGESIFSFNTPISGSQVRYDGDYGAMLIDAQATSMDFKFYTRTGTVIDDYTINSSAPPPSGATIIPPGSTWKYLDNGSNQGTAWRGSAFDDSTWKSGPAQLGYGDGDEATVVGFGSNANNKFITTYFRRTFNIADASAVTALNLKLLRDDGAVVHLNGTEVDRDNMPGGTITSSTLASTAVGGTDESTFFPATLNTAALVSGTNVLAVEIHQSSGSSSDISFDLELDATIASTPATPAAPAGLAASAVSSSQINLTWQDKSSNETGFILERSTDNFVSNITQIATPGVNQISYNDTTGLAPNTTYYYRIRATNNGNDSANSAVASATTSPSNAPVTVTYIPTGSVWKYLDNGTNQGTAWRATAFDDSTWKSGAAQLGYGDGDETTVVSFGPNANNKFITTYFRKSFTIADPSQVSAMTLRILRDDGAVVYLNGTEVYRTNMPSGTITSSTLASTAIEDNTYYSVSINPALLVAGTNVIAVEIHQAEVTSSDISFDFELKATVSSTAPTAPTAPSGLAAAAVSASQINLTWKDNSNNESNFILERSTDNFVSNITQIATPAANQMNYSDSTGLSPNTTYYYRIRATNSIGPSDNSNIANATTLPVTTLPAPWADGDIGSPGVVGSASYNNGTFTLSGGGDVWNTADTCHFVYQPFTGSGQIMVRVDAWLSGHANAYTGVMFRESLAANARETSLVIDHTNLIGWIRRTSTGGSSTGPTATGSVLPIWLKLVKNGTSFTAWRSINGTTWTQISTAQTINMTASPIYVGLVVASSVTGVLSRYNVDGVLVSSSTDPQLAASLRTNPPQTVVATTMVTSPNSFAALSASGGGSTPPTKKLLDELM